MFITKIHISLQVTLSAAELEKHLPASAEIVGEALTEAVLANVKQQNLGYFPSLDFFQQQGLMDDDLMDAADTIAWFAAKLVREEVQIKLRPFFSKMEFQSVKCSAFGMPSVRPNQLDAWQALVEHYTPNQIKIDVLASVLKKNNQQQGMANWAKQLFRRNLAESFAQLDVTAASVVNKTTSG